MAYTALTVYAAGTGGVAYTKTDSTVGGLKFSNDGNVYLYLHNNGASTATVTVVTPNTYQGLAVDNVAIALTAGQIKIAGPFPTELFNVASGDDAGCVRLTFGGTGSADVDVMAFR